MASRGSGEDEKTKAHIRRQLELFKGNEVSYHNGDVLAAFDGPARAIRCAASITESASRLGTEVKIGLHTGECDFVDGKFSGFAVELARQIANESEPYRVLVSRTVKDLVAGSGLIFEEHSTTSFEGVDGEWHLFSVKI